MDGISFILVFVDLFVTVFNILLLVRVLMSWVAPDPQGGIGRLIVELTEPILGPVRKILPSPGGMDFSPFAVYLLMFIGQRLLHGYLG